MDALQSRGNREPAEGLQQWGQLSTHGEVNWRALLMENTRRIKVTPENSGSSPCSRTLLAVPSQHEAVPTWPIADCSSLSPQPFPPAAGCLRCPDTEKITIRSYLVL